MFAALVSVSSCELCLVDSEDLALLVSSTPLVLTLFLPPPPEGFLSSEGREIMETSNSEVHVLGTGCRPLHLFLSAEGDSFSDDN